MLHSLGNVWSLYRYVDGAAFRASGAVQVLCNHLEGGKQSSQSFTMGGGGEQLNCSTLCRLLACKIWGFNLNFKEASIGKTIAISPQFHKIGITLFS